jgi:hypothetical protein
MVTEYDIMKALQSPAIYHGVANIYHALRVLGIEGDLEFRIGGQSYLIIDPDAQIRDMRKESSTDGR